MQHLFKGDKFVRVWGIFEIECRSRTMLNLVNKNRSNQIYNSRRASNNLSNKKAPIAGTNLIFVINFNFGSGGGDRTRDLRLMNPAL
jgi:hypothetical protein